MWSKSIEMFNPYEAMLAAKLESKDNTKKSKKRFLPKIVIWDVSLTHKTGKDIFASFYFLSYKKAIKFIEKNIEAWNNDYIVHLDGGFLWF